MLKVNVEDNKMETDDGAAHRAESPLPIKLMFPLGLVLLNESICSTMLLPYVSLLVAHLRQRPVDESGYMTGILFGTFMFGQLLSSRMWGHLSDRYGRRAPMIIGLFSGGFMVLGFGLSTSVWMCIVFRFLHGLFNGNVLVAKTALADILDETNEAKGFTLVSFTYGIGLLVGPAVGGLLYDPANNGTMLWAGIAKDSVFAQFPGLMPAIAAFVYNVFAIACSYLYLPETNPCARSLPAWLDCLNRGAPCWKEVTTLSEGSESAQDTVVDGECDLDSMNLQNDLGNNCAKMRMLSLNVADEMHLVRPYKRSLALLTENQPDKTVEGWGALGSVRCEGDKNEGDSGCESCEETNQLLGRGTERLPLDDKRNGTLESFGYWDSIKDPKTRVILILYMMLACADVAFSEIFPLWATASVGVGGLGYQSGIVGFLLLANSIPCLLSNICLHIAYRVVPNRMHLWCFCMYGMACAVGFLPFIVYAPLSCRIHLLLICCFVRQWFSSWSFGVVSIITAHAAPQGHVGTMYGITQSCSSAVRCVTPSTVTATFAWSLSGAKPLPFNHVFVFLITSVLYALTGILPFAVGTESDVAAQRTRVELEVVTEHNFEDK
uniref:Putative transporter n=1 Tax=Trypanosoma vivax (strain Y486) TaxID=1055687 RepID=G0U3F7_TRYVY|nr:putative transporter [Trypanosoma vivax Y486]